MAATKLRKMKNVIKSTLFMAAAAQTETAAGAVAPVAPVEAPLESETLTALKAEAATQWQAMMKLTDPFSKETKDAKMVFWQLEGKIKAEEGAILAARKEAENEQLRNDRLKLNVNQFAAYDRLNAVKADKKATPEAIAEAQTEFDTAKELVDNELLARYAKSKPAKASADGKPVSDKAAEKTAILDLYLAGSTHKEIEAAGHARSTVWHVINNYKIANGK